MKRKRPFCGVGCKENYSLDRSMGLIYGSWLVDSEDVQPGMHTWPAPTGHDGVLVGWEDGSYIAQQCAYCGAGLKRKG